MSQNIFKGLGIALITPFNASGAVDYVVLKQLVEYQLKNGADFFCILATTGETPTLTDDEKQRIKELVVEVGQAECRFSWDVAETILQPSLRNSIRAISQVSMEY